MIRTYIYLKDQNEDLIYYMKSIIEYDKFEELNSNLFYMESNVVDSSDLSDILENLESDFLLPIKALESEIELSQNLVVFILNFLKNAKNGYYKLNDLLEKIVLDNDIEGKESFKYFYSTKLSDEIIYTGLRYICIGNSIKAAEDLYIHRNTLNYRIDSIKKVTSLDLKEFKDQFAFYGLFK